MILGTKKSGLNGNYHTPAVGGPTQIGPSIGLALNPSYSDYSWLRRSFSSTSLLKMPIQDLKPSIANASRRFTAMIRH
jgi:hypothetical protein